MAKLTLNAIGSRYGSIDALNDNFDAIEQALENTLSRDGTSPNALEADLDMNGNQILNASTINASTLIIGGQTLEPGDAVASATVQVFEFTATAGQTSFSVSPLTPTSSSVLMEVNGLSLPTSSLVTSGSTLSFPALTLGDEVVVKVFTKEIGAYPAITNNEVAANAAIVSSKLAFTQAGTTQVRSVQDKMRDVVSVKDFGAVGDGVTDDTVAIQAAMTAAAAVNVELEFSGETYAVSSTGTFALTAPASLTMRGVAGVTTIKLLSATVDTHIIGRSSASTYFRMEGITLDGNKSVITTRNTGGLYFSNAQVVISRNNVFKDMNDLGAFASKCIYVEAPAPGLGEYAESTGDQYLNCEGYPFQTYRIARNIVEDAYCTGALISFTDINGQTIPSTIYAKTQINNNVVICDAAFSAGFSVLSLMGNDIECTGNKINGGGTGIVCHAGTNETLYNYFVSGNHIYSTKGSAIVVNQTSGSSASNRNVVVSGNMIYQPALDGITVVGTYAGGSTTPQANVTISGNVIYDYLTNNPAPGSTISGIRLLGVVNTTVVGNSISGSRWAGICVHRDGRNIDIVGNVIVDHQGRTTVTPEHGAPILVTSGASTAYLGNINVASNTIRNYCSTVSPAATSIRTGGIVVNEANAQDISIRGNRIMDGNAPGISLYLCLRVTAMDNEVTGWATAALNDYLLGAGCQLAYAISGPTYDTTANRPTLSAAQPGYSMWDSTLNKPIWWNGSVWKDANNATV